MFVILGKSHYLLYGLATAMQPRMLVTFDEELNPLPVSVRVGQAVDVVGAVSWRHYLLLHYSLLIYHYSLQAGKPKTITGFQTHTTPVLISTKERAELATEAMLSVSSVLEGIVILKDNPDYEEPEANNDK